MSTTGGTLLTNYDPERVAALSHQLLTAATPDGHNEITVDTSPGELAAVVQASATVIGCLLKWLAAERDEPEEQIAAQLHADLLLLQLSEE